MNLPVLTVTNTTQATTSERLMKIRLYSILFIEYRNNVATMLQRCAILQTVKTDVFFPDRVIFL